MLDHPLLPLLPHEGLEGLVYAIILQLLSCGSTVLLYITTLLYHTLIICPIALNVTNIIYGHVWLFAMLSVHSM